MISKIAIGKLYIDMIHILAMTTMQKQFGFVITCISLPCCVMAVTPLYVSVFPFSAQWYEVLSERVERMISGCYADMHVNL